MMTRLDEYVMKLSEQVNSDLESIGSGSYVKSQQQHLDVLDVIANGIDAQCYNEGRLVSIHTDSPLTYNDVHRDMSRIGINDQQEAWAAMLDQEISDPRFYQTMQAHKRYLKTHKKIVRNAWLAGLGIVVGSIVLAATVEPMLGVLLPACIFAPVGAIFASEMNHKRLWGNLFVSRENLTELIDAGKGKNILNIDETNAKMTSRENITGIAALENGESLINLKVDDSPAQGSSELMTVQEVVTYKTKEVMK